MSDQPESVQRRRSMATGPTVAPVLPAAHATDPAREDSRVIRLGFAMAAVVGALAVPSFTGASGCPSTCGAAKRTCQLAGVTAFRSCRVTVKASGQTGQDRRGAIKSSGARSRRVSRRSTTASTAAGHRRVRARPGARARGGCACTTSSAPRRRACAHVRRPRAGCNASRRAPPRPGRPSKTARPQSTRASPGVRALRAAPSSTDFRSPRGSGELGSPDVARVTRSRCCRAGWRPPG